MFACEHYQTLNVYIDPHSLYKNLEDASHLPGEFREMLQNQGRLGAQTPFILKRKISPRSRLMVNQIFNCPYNGVLEKLYLECKCTELLISQLAEMTREPTPKGSASPLHSLDRERIHFAREIIIRDMGNSPSLH